jgi:hypothetical protein
MGFFFSYFHQIKRIDSKTSQTSFLTWIANKDNSKVIPKSSSIKLTKASGFVTFPQHFKHMVMVDCNSSKNNQWLQNWFKTHAFTIGEKNP